jgi:hypothetical protein
MLAFSSSVSLVPAIDPHISYKRNRPESPSADRPHLRHLGGRDLGSAAHRAGFLGVVGGGGEGEDALARRLARKRKEREVEDTIFAPHA